MDALEKNLTWKILYKPRHKMAIGYKWIF